MDQRVTQVYGGELDEVGLDVRGHAGAAAAGPAHGRHGPQNALSLRFDFTLRFPNNE